MAHDGELRRSSRPCEMGVGYVMVHAVAHSARRVVGVVCGIYMAALYLYLVCMLLLY